MKARPAHIFPAFVPEYTGNETLLLHGFSPGFAAMLREASEITGYPVAQLSIEGREVPGDELLSQYITYIHSCGLSDVLRSALPQPLAGAGYSMGLYGLLYHSGSIRFATGLEIIATAFRMMRESLPAGSYGMAVIGGLSSEDIKQLIASLRLRCNLINMNSPFSGVVSGILSDVEQAVEAAVTEGALHTRVLKVSLPYHSYRLEAVKQNFGDYIDRTEVCTPAFKIYSLYDNGIISGSDGLREELKANLCTPMNWHQTFNRMLNDGFDTFIECGAGESLTKIARFIDGSFTVVPMKKINDYLNNYRNER